MEYIISTRFHATILALKFRQKVFPVVYGDKIESLLSDLGGYDNGASYDLRKEDKWDTRKVWKSFKEDRINEEKLSQWETAAKRHFTVLDEYINKLQ